jgi:WD40 repeat protein
MSVAWAGSTPYKAFISYSHAADDELAPALQRGLQRLARTWYRTRALEVFRDRTGLAVTPALWSAIRSALDQSEFFVLLASPEAAASKWVNREIEYWLAGHAVERFLPVVTAGEWVWDHTRNDFDWDASTAVPPALAGVFREEPRHLDLSWARSETQLDLRHGRFRDAVAELAAPMHGMSKEDLDSEEVLQHRRVARLRRGVVAALCTLLVLVSAAGVMAVRNARAAAAYASEALSQQRLAERQRQAAADSADEAGRQQQNAEAERTRAEQAAAEARRQQRIAEAEQARAERAAAEARRQQHIALAEQTRAQRAAVEARRQRRAAQDEQAKAVRAAAEAVHQRGIAEAERRHAEQAAAEAMRQKEIAQEQQRIATARQLLAQADGARDTDPGAALMLGIAAQQVHPDDMTRASLINAVATTPFVGALAGHAGPVQSAAFAPDGHTLATSADDSTILWAVSDWAAPREVGRLPSGGGSRTVAFAPDGRTLAVAESGSVTLWDVTDPATPRPLRPLAVRGVDALGFAPDGLILATAAALTVILWDVSDRAAPRRLGQLPVVPLRRFGAVTFAADGHTLATGGADGTLSLWDVTNPSAPQRLGGPLTAHDTAVTTMAFATDGHTLLTSDGTVIIWDVTGEPPPRTWSHLMAPRSEPAAFSADGDLIAVGGSDHTVTLWDATNRAAPRRLGQSVRHPAPVTAVALASDGRRLAAGGSDGTVTVWNTADRDVLRRRSQSLRPTGRVSGVRFAPVGHTLATGSDGGFGGGGATVSLWDLTDLDGPRRLSQLATTADHVVSAVAFAPDGRTLAVGDTDGFSGTLTLWDATDPATPRQLGRLTAPPGPVTFAPNGDLLTIGFDETFTLWDVGDRSAPRRLGQSPPGNARLLSAAFANDGSTLATGTNMGNVILWDVTNRATPVRLGQPLNAGTSNVDGVAFTADGRTLVAGGTDRLGSTMTLWDVTDRTAPRRLGEPLRHSDPLMELAFAPDARTMATSHTNGTVVLWNVTNREAASRLGQITAAHTNTVWSLAYAPDGRTLATGSDDGTVDLWDLANLIDLQDHALERACAITGRGLNPDEWVRYLSGHRYRNTCP